MSLAINTSLLMYLEKVAENAKKKRRQNLFFLLLSSPHLWNSICSLFFSGLHNFLASSTVYIKESKIVSFAHSTEPHVYSHSALIAKKRERLWSRSMEKYVFYALIGFLSGNDDDGRKKKERKRYGYAY
jgi:hypothetical protein